MALDHGIVGVTRGPWTRSWTSTDSLTYALGVGAGQLDPTRELAFTTENTAGVSQQALPTYAIVIAQFGGPQNGLAGVDFTQLLHAEQALTLHRPMPVAGSVSLTSTITDIFDKGKGALVVNEVSATDPDDGEPVFTARSSVFIRGEGGFGGDRGPSDPWQRPDRDPDLTVVMPTRPEQALVYRLSGDRNPLHADPKFAARGGFSKPILHGLCTYGVTGRALLHALCGSDPARFGSMSGRFSRPVFPGETLTVSIWRDDDGSALFQTANQDGAVVIDRGRLATRGG